jgi:hypothetical protein
MAARLTGTAYALRSNAAGATMRSSGGSRVGNSSTQGELKQRVAAQIICYLTQPSRCVRRRRFGAS